VPNSGETQYGAAQDAIRRIAKEGRKYGIEQPALAWLRDVDWSVRSGAEIPPGEPSAEHDDHGQVMLAQPQRGALARRYSALLTEALEDDLRRGTAPTYRGVPA